MNTPSLKKNFVWTFLGNATYAGSQWGILVVLSKLRSASDLGIFVYALALATPTFMFANLQLRAIQGTDVRERYAFNLYFTVRLICVTLGILVLTIILLLMRTDRLTFYTGVFIMIARAVECMSDIFYGAMQMREEMRLQAQSLILKGVLTLPLLCLGLWLTNSVVGAAAGVALAWTVLLLVYDVPVTLRLLARTHEGNRSPSSFLKLSLPKAPTKLLLSDALPLGVVMLFLSLNTNIPRYFMKGYAGTAALGIFAALNYLQVAGSTVITALGQSASPKLARFFQTGYIKQYKVLLYKLLLLGGGLGALAIVGAILFGREALTLLYRREYAAYHRELIIIAVGAAMSYSFGFLGYAMTAACSYRPQLISIIASTGALVVSCYLLIPRWNIAGAAYVNIIYLLVMASINAVIIVRFVREAESKHPFQPAPGHGAETTQLAAP
jgi:O-antigen/teichoic acid export membrane protein